MDSENGNAPSWLFSFVDLAFLMLLAMTQLASDVNAPDLGQLIVPRIHAEETPTSLPAQAEVRWQVRVHPPEADAAPFDLVHGADPAESGARLGAPQLRQQLAALKAADEARPLLAPHEDARTQDTFDAIALIEQGWPGRRRAIVSPRMGGR